MITMNLETFFNHFELLANAPNGVKKLRELILQLAVQGKLVPQDENDEPASVLLEKIKAERARLVKEKKIKKSDPLTPIKEDEIPYDLPIGWEWVRLSEIGHDWGQKKPDIEFTYIDVSAINKEKGIISDNFIILQPENAPSRARKIVKKDTVIYSTVRPYLLNIAIVDQEFFPEPIVSTAFAIIHPYINVSNRYIYYYLRSQIFINYVESQMTGMAYPAINDRNFFQGLIPLPPLNEQHRIVEKVDQLIKLCNELETRKTQQKHQLILLGETATNKLINAPNQAEFNHNWQQINQHFDLIYSSPQNIKQLRQAILQLAVMGKLVPQDENDEPASILLEKINAEKARLVKEKKIKKSDPLTPITDDEIPYSLPIAWEWVKLGQCIDLISGQHLDKNQQNTEENGLPYITGPSDFSDLNPIITRWTNIFKVIACKNDILVTVKGAGVGKSNILNIEKAAIGRQIMAVRSLLISYHYTYLFILSSYQKLQNLGTGSTVPGLSRENILELEFPLPPLNEQHRIVEKVDQLMKYCDQLESQLTQATEDSQKLIETAVNQLLAS